MWSRPQRRREHVGTPLGQTIAPRLVRGRVGSRPTPVLPPIGARWARPPARPLTCVQSNRRQAVGSIAAAARRRRGWRRGRQPLPACAAGGGDDAVFVRPGRHPRQADVAAAGRRGAGGDVGWRPPAASGGGPCWGGAPRRRRATGAVRLLATGHRRRRHAVTRQRPATTAHRFRLAAAVGRRGAARAWGLLRTVANAAPDAAARPHAAAGACPTPPTAPPFPTSARASLAIVLHGGGGGRAASRRVRLARSGRVAACSTRRPQRHHRARLRLAAPVPRCVGDVTPPLPRLRHLGRRVPGAGGRRTARRCRRCARRCDIAARHDRLPRRCRTGPRMPAVLAPCRRLSGAAGRSIAAPPTTLAARRGARRAWRRDALRRFRRRPRDTSKLSGAGGGPPLRPRTRLLGRRACGGVGGGRAPRPSRRHVLLRRVAVAARCLSAARGRLQWVAAATLCSRAADVACRPAAACR